MTRVILMLVVAAFLNPSVSGLPAFYEKVDAIVWVVEDLDTAAAGWTKLGFSGITELGVQDAGQGIQYRGESLFPRYGLAAGRIGETAVYWVRPVNAEEAFGKFLARHGSGIFSLMHRAPSIQSLEEEVSRLARLGVEVLQSGVFATAGGTVKYVFFDTEPGGKYSLGLFAGPLEGSPLHVPPPANPVDRIVQFAFAVHDLEAVSAYWSSLGFPAFSYSHPEISELRYKDGPGDFDMKLGWQRHGSVPFEWTQSLKGPNVYLDHLKEHGEGVHHIAFNVEDMDNAVARWQSLGFQYSMGGAWGEKGKPGSGRFVYMDAQAIGGTDVELLWNYRD